MSDQYTNEVRNQWSGGYTGKTPQLVLKESLIAAAAFGGRGNEAMDYNEDADSIWSGFQQVLSHVIPPAIGFRRMRARVPDLIIETKSGDFIFDDASGGLAAVIEVAWQIFLRSRTYSSFTVLLDEPENHLHPSLQREIIPSLLRAFPKVQFIVATHSPFVVTATPDSYVYALDYGPNGLVYSRKLDYANKAASADETLRRVLGVESTMPAWAETKFSQIVSQYMHSLLNDERLRALRNELKANGLETEFPDAVVRLTDNFGDDRATE
ncbi:AAA family ATPase [Rhodococcus sp. NPDC055024]